MKTIIAKLRQKFPYTGADRWALIWALAFIVSQLLWFLSKLVKRYDMLEIPAAIFFFPLAPFFSPHDMMVNRRDIFVYALAYWVALFVVALLVSRKRIHPAVPAAGLILLNAIVSIIYSVFFVYRGPVP